MLQLVAVSRCFGDFTAVQPLSLNFAEGERYAIVGESGSGKTTLARMIAGLERPTSGNVLVDGRSVYGSRRVARTHFKTVQLIAQDSSSALDPLWTVGRIVEEPLMSFFQLDKAARKKRVEELLMRCNLPLAYVARRPQTLSGGEQKRVAIARALAAEPRMLVFDEATNGFDLPLRKKIVEEIGALQHQLGFTMVFITHDMELACAVCDHILVMRQGTLLEKVDFQGDPEVFTHAYSRQLLQASGLLDES